MRYDAAFAHVRCEWDGHTFTCAENEMDRDEVHAANSLAVCLQMGRRPLPTDRRHAPSPCARAASERPAEPHVIIRPSAEAPTAQRRQKDMVYRRRAPGQERRSSIKTEVAARGFAELRPAEHLVDVYGQPSTERRLAKPRAATFSSIPARLISRAASDDEMNPSPSLPSLKLFDGRTCLDCCN